VRFRARTAAEKQFCRTFAAHRQALAISGPITRRSPFCRRSPAPRIPAPKSLEKSSARRAEKQSRRGSRRRRMRKKRSRAREKRDNPDNVVSAVASRHTASLRSFAPILPRNGKCYGNLARRVLSTRIIQRSLSALAFVTHSRKPGALPRARARPRYVHIIANYAKYAASRVNRGNLRHGASYDAFLCSADGCMNNCEL